MTDRIVITGISGVRPHRHHDVVHVDCSSDQRSTHLALHRGVLGTLIVSLLQAARAFPGESDEFLSQPLQPASSRSRMAASGSSSCSTKGCACSLRFHPRASRHCAIA
jgi:hypothetical protein